ncbi:similar to Saccharomyces cerevisiae YGR196C FYV8 Protein of unknown function [Maudiozyma saulgeensis]|uniref:Protein FYV8 n=1 Tax=Maudiozyma saulgeensis TaxID=1789683 RepID=A0A1X7R715_9SACH|nr:similar to Saccharomyces cerevisiae YGR196C FYV8 Protein of unknown function [Kazachstania saulgeensis]
MSEQVNRRKSYRWTSASQTNYDGADWDSSDEEEHGDASQKMKLPTLPKLDYGDEVNASGDPEIELPQMPQQEEQITEVPSPEVQLPQKFSRQSKNNQFSDDLDNLMVQISKEMTPKEPQQGTFGDINQDDDDIDSPHTNIVDETVSSEQDTEDDDMQVSKGGYFASMIDNDDDTDDKEHQEPVEQESFQDQEEQKDNISAKISETQSNSTIHIEHETTPQAAHENMEEPESTKPNNGSENDEFPILAEYATKSDTDDAEELSRLSEEHENENVSTLVSAGVPIPDLSYRDSSDEFEPDATNQYKDDNDEDDALSYTNSITYDTEEPREDESPFKFTNKKIRESIIHSSSSESNNDKEKDDNSSDDNPTMNISESGYFSKMMQDNDSIPDTPVTKESINNLEKDDDKNGDILSIPSSVESKDTIEKAHDGEKGIKPDGDDTSSEANDIEQKDSIQGEDSSLLDTTHEDTDRDDSSSAMTDLTGDKVLNPDDTEEEGDDDKIIEDKNATDLDKSRQSVNLGKWKPDTDSLRSGFVQETSKKAPPGFVYDENGNLIDLTPSSMKGRAVSTYSGIESGWNAFPSEDNDNSGELETIRDTKTIYDNSTIYNVPGLIGRANNLPPLPNNIDTNMKTDINNNGNEQQDTSRLRSISNATYSSERKVEGPGIHQPNSQEIARINQIHSIPQLDLNKLIISNLSNASKYDQLTSYYEELGNYDTGIQTWISYSLKASSKEKEFLFQEYKDNRHVREAYANAEDLTKKNTVINTVNTVNQNVSHLKKKVFSHTMNSMKPKMLFSSIGKKKL